MRAAASLTEHEEIEVPLGSACLVLCPTGVEARIILLDPWKMEGPGPVQEVVTAHLGYLGRRGQGELVSRVWPPPGISNKETEAQGASGLVAGTWASDSQNSAVPSPPCSPPGFIIGPQSFPTLRPVHP